MIIDYFRHGWTRLLRKDTAGLRDGKGLICLKAILKYRHGSLPQKNKLSRELAKQAVTTKCRGYINAELSRVFEKAVFIRAKNKNL